MVSLYGPIELPSPITSSVTPWRMSLSAAPSSIRLSVDQLSMLMKPGVTVRPVASRVSRAVPGSFGATATILSFTMATSPT